MPVRQEVTSQGHCSFPPLWVPWETSPLPLLCPGMSCVTHITVKRNNSRSLCAYCLYTHHMSWHTECHHGEVGTSTASLGAARLYNVWDASFLSRRDNLQPAQSVSVRRWSVTLARRCTESHRNAHRLISSRNWLNLGDTMCDCLLWVCNSTWNISGTATFQKLGINLDVSWMKMNVWRYTTDSGKVFMSPWRPHQFWTHNPLIAEAENSYSNWKEQVLSWRLCGVL